MAEVQQLARVGDAVECDVRNPHPRTIRMVLETPAAAAHANGLLLDPQSGWRLSAPRGVPACRKCGAKRGERCAGDWTTCEGSAAHLERTAGVKEGGNAS